MSAPASPKPGRQIGGWQSSFAAPFDKNILKCSADVRVELLASIDMYAEIKDAGKELLKANGHQNLAKAYPRFQAYIRQAKTFFQAAEALHHRAAALNYYYSCLNFAKALIFLRMPTFVDHNLHHGITPKPSRGQLGKQSIQINGNGVLPKFYHLVTSHTFNAGTKLKITDLFGYCSDVEYEYQKLKYGDPVSFPSRLIIGIDTPQQKRTEFAVLAVSNGHHPAFEKVRSFVEKNFHEVVISEQNARNIFGMLALERNITRFFESNKEWKSSTTRRDLANELETFLADLISYVPFDDNRLFLLNRPVKKGGKTYPMPELIAIYCCMYFLGSLVRYRSDLLEAMLEKKDAWLIERFTKSAPLTFVRLMRNLFDKQYLAFSTR